MKSILLSTPGAAQGKDLMCVARLVKDDCLQAIPFGDISPIMNRPPFFANGKWYYELQSKVDDTDLCEIKPPYADGDIVYGREQIRTICYGRGDQFGYGEFCIEYLADKQLVKCSNEDWWRHNWRVRPATPLSSTQMPAWAARFHYEITGVRCLQVQDIGVSDAIDMGCFPKPVKGTTRLGGEPEMVTADFSDEIDDFKNHWNTRHPGSWERNDWIWLYNLKPKASE